jgi:hypothetical protein
VEAPLELNVGGYGYGLGVSQSCASDIPSPTAVVAGYGSLMRWLPEYGVGLIAMGNVTYASFGDCSTTPGGAATPVLQPRW